MTREILFKGFAPNENGTEIAVVDGKEYKGNWVEGGYVTGAGITKLLRFEKRFNEDLAYHGCKDCGTIKTYGYKVIPETVCQYTGLKDKNGKKIFEGDVAVPVWVSPSGKIDGINEDMQGKVIYKAGSFYVVPRCEMEYQICDYVRKKFIEYRSNVGEIYDFANNMFLGEVIGTIFDKED